MKIDEKLLRDAFAQVFGLMLENNTDLADFTFSFKGYKAKFELRLIELVKDFKNDSKK